MCSAVRVAGSDLRIIPTSPIEGQNVRVIVEVTNSGVEDTIFPASLWVDESLEDSEALAVAAGETEQISFILRNRVGKHRIRVDRLLGEFEVRPSVRLLEQPPLEFSTPVPSAATAPTPTATATALATPAPPTPVAKVAPQPTATARPLPTATTIAVETALHQAPAPPSQPQVESGAPSGIDEGGGINRATIIILIVVGIAVLAGIAAVARGLRVRKLEV